MNMRKSLCAVLAIGVSVAMLSGCDNLTRERYEMITVNVDREMDVAKMIGDPDYRMPEKWHYERVDKHLNVFIHFNDGGTVVRKEWIDTLNDTWEDTKDPGDDPSYESTEIRKSQQ